MAEDEFKIIKGAGSPPPKRNIVYPFGSMDVGDAFDVPLARLQAVSSCAVRWGQRNGCKFTARKISDEAGRIWRVS